ncbi:MAG: MobC family plasmid mobilization relaxosome protein [Symploca sp. SIO1C4]|uniref:MobC family plasmid mobilization relaxosome protein n=1 Tax=Symploca sp. SIO1C4 TaxID=2607765 RepID=A0A6B3NKL9_9CYAN|nr:MobC family plasmid mobilization relaxosome protein [Symploca sp. SIO1C4]
MGKYCERLDLRLTPEQKQQLLTIAQNNKSKVSEVIRQQIFQEKPKLRGERRSLYNELSRIGNNLNQIARVLNSTPLSRIPLPTSQIIELKQELLLTTQEVKKLQLTLTNDC